MANLYLILDTTNTNYGLLLSSIKSEVNQTFKPRLSNDGNKALIQIKAKYITRTASLRSQLSSFVIGSGDEDWALRQVGGDEWTVEMLGG